MILVNTIFVRTILPETKIEFENEDFVVPD